MNVEMVLRLVDQATAPLRGVANEFQNLEKAAKELGRGAGAKMGAYEYFEGLKMTGEEAERTRQRVDDLRDSLSRIGTASLAFQNMARVGAEIARPMDTAIDKAREFEKQIRSITVAGDILGQDEAIGRGILEASRESGLKWEEIARGERALVELGGGEYVAKIAGVREKLAKLAKAAEADPAELYNMMYHYMELNHLTEKQAYEALSINYAQGKKGAYELKNMAQGLPKLEGLAMDYYGKNAGWQVAVDIPAALQMLRKVTGSPGEADTRLRHLLTKLTDPNEAKKIEKELGVDVYATRAKAMKSGADPLFATLDAIADELGRQGPKAGKLNNQTHQVEDVDMKKLGGIARDYYFRSGIEAWTQMRKQLPEFILTSAEATKTVDESFRAHMETAAAAARLANSLDAAAIKIGTTQLGADKKKSELEETLARKGADFLGEHPYAADAAAYASWTGGHGLEALGKVGEVGLAGWAGVQTLRYLRARSAAGAGAAESAFANAPNLKGAPIDPSSPNVGAMANYEQAVRALAENGGKAEGLTGTAAETFAKAHPAAQARMMEAAEEALKSAPGGGSLLENIAKGLGKGLVYGAVSMASGWALDEAEKRLFGWTPENTKKGEEIIHAKAADWYRSHGFPVPSWPSFTGSAKGEQLDDERHRAELGGPAIKLAPDAAGEPKADTSGFADAGAKAEAAGRAIIAGLSVTAKPAIDFSCFEALHAHIAKSMRGLRQLAAAAKSTTAEAAHSIRRGYSPGSHALHDGSELY